MTYWSRKSFGNKMNAANVMISGLKEQLERASNRGLNEEFVNRMETLMNDSMKLDTEQETLKSKLKTKTAELNDKVDELTAMVEEAKKVIKLEFEPEMWKMFGISDKR